MNLWKLWIAQYVSKREKLKNTLFRLLIFVWFLFSLGAVRIQFSLTQSSSRVRKVIYLFSVHENNTDHGAINVLAALFPERRD